MRITSFEYRDNPPGTWRIHRIELAQLNLFVGGTGSGKTRTVNAIFDVAVFATSGPVTPQGVFQRAGAWTVVVGDEQQSYEWSFDIRVDEDKRMRVESETITRRSADKKVETIVQRTRDLFTFKGEPLPKMQRDAPAVFLLKEEEAIAPLHYCFSHMQRRVFAESSLTQLVSYSVMTTQMRAMAAKDLFETMYLTNMTLNNRLQLLKEHRPTLFDEVVRIYRTIFPTIENAGMQDLRRIREESGIPGDVPVFAVKERNVASALGPTELSSGMQKVLLILTDVVSLPRRSIYIIDEYENSLGVNAINFLPDFLAEHGDDHQFIVTTHHPYLINAFPVKSWRVFHRRGSEISTRMGAEFEARVGRSKQEAFTQLINDKFYVEGAE